MRQSTDWAPLTSIELKLRYGHAECRFYSNCETRVLQPTVTTREKRPFPSGETVRFPESLCGLRTHQYQLVSNLHHLRHLCDCQEAASVGVCKMDLVKYLGEDGANEPVCTELCSRPRPTGSAQNLIINCVCSRLYPQCHKWGCHFWHTASTHWMLV